MLRNRPTGITDCYRVVCRANPRDFATLQRCVNLRIRSFHSSLSFDFRGECFGYAYGADADEQVNRLNNDVAGAWKELELSKSDVRQKKSPRNSNDGKARLDARKETHAADEQHRYAHDKASENMDSENTC